MRAVGRVAKLHGGGVTIESPKWRFGGWGLIKRGLGGGGDDGEAIFGVSETCGGRGWDRDDEDRAVVHGAGGGECG
jgi:hypothetical protein